MRVIDIASLDVRSCRQDANLATVASLMWEQDCGVVPVVDEKNLVVGIITDRDICMAAATRPEHISEIPARELMSRIVHTCRLIDDVKVALQTMQHNSVRRLPVVNEKGVLSGIVSLTDLLLASHDSKTARPDSVLWSDVVPVMETIARPRKTRQRPLVVPKQAVLATQV